MKVKLIPTHRFQVISFAGVEVGKDAAVEIPAGTEADAAADPRLILIDEAEPEAVKPAAKKGKGSK